ncbi:MAG: helix-turn-helix transcriptional regulator [Firmicutes bacterium]|nr:helix-turn-helix transcriptional regulator [Bacillota bacterium]
MSRVYRIDRKEWRRLLKEADLTQGELAKRVGMNSNSMSRKVLGKREITVSELIRIADELNTSPLNLIKRIEPDGGSSSSIG